MFTSYCWVRSLTNLPVPLLPLPCRWSWISNVYTYFSNWYRVLLSVAKYLFNGVESEMQWERDKWVKWSVIESLVEKIGSSKWQSLSVKSPIKRCWRNNFFFSQYILIRREFTSNDEFACRNIHIFFDELHAWLTFRFSFFSIANKQKKEIYDWNSTEK